MDPTKRVNDLIVITDRLTDLLERENGLLRERRHAELGLMIDEKTTLGRVYESRVLGLADAEAELAEVDGDLRQRLVEAGQRVDELMAENAMLLEVAIVASQRVLDLVSDAVRDAANETGAYDRRGTTETSLHSGSTPRVALSVNQTL